MGKKRVLSKISFAIGIVLCIIFGFILICNLINFIKKAVEPDKPPAIFGITPMVVCSGSMSGNASDSLEVNDLIFIIRTDMEKMKIGKIIAFYDNNMIVSHRIIDIKETEDGLLFITKGDANNVEDDRPITADNFIGVVRGRIRYVGAIALFLQQPLGLLLFGVLPLSIIVISYILLGKRIVNSEVAEVQTESESLNNVDDIVE